MGRHHPSSQPRLITLAISPYTELARWSLELCGIGYEERRQAIVIQRAATRLAGGLGTAPVLVTPDGVLKDSVAIAEWADAEARRRGTGPGTYPTEPAEREQAERLVRHFADDLGIPGRRIPWSHFIDHPKQMARYWSVGLPPWQARLQPWLLRAARRPIKGAVGLSPEEVAAAPGQVEAVFDLIAGMLADGRPYLLGAEFGIADICFAAMATVVVCPSDGYPVPHPQPEDLPPDLAELIRGFRAHPAGEYALRVYREHRRPG